MVQFDWYVSLDIDCLNFSFKNTVDWVLEGIHSDRGPSMNWIEIRIFNYFLVMCLPAS